MGEIAEDIVPFIIAQWQQPDVNDDAREPWLLHAAPMLSQPVNPSAADSLPQKRQHC